MPYPTSGQELIFKRWLTKKGIPFIKEGCSLDTGGARKQYTPDFYLTDLNVFIEIKPRNASDEIIYIQKAVETNSPRMNNFSFFAVSFPSNAKYPEAFKAFTAETEWVHDAEKANILFYQTLGLDSTRQPRQKTAPEPGRRTYRRPTPDELKELL
jgi:hypothetical protein